jgi:hypothetical protein
MESNGELLKVYELLTQEIQSAETQTYQLVSIGAGAVAAILAAGFNQRDDILRLFMCLTSYLIILAVIRLLGGNRSRIWRIATYMRVHLESELRGVKWQTHLAALSTILRGKSTFIAGSQMLVLGFATVAVGIATFVNLCIIAHWSPASFIPGRGGFEWSALAAGAAAMIANGGLLYYEAKVERDSRRGGPIEQSWLQGWEAIRSAVQTGTDSGRPKPPLRHSGA